MTTPVVARRARQPKVMAESLWNHLESLAWVNPVSCKLQAATGDAELHAAFDGKRGCWVLARRILVHVARGTDRVPAMGFWPWKEWRDDETGAPLSIDDPRLTDYVQRCDGWRREKQITAVLDEACDDAPKRKEAQDTIDALVREPEVRRAFAKFADAKGLSRHRLGGTEGGKISTASLWRSGAGSIAAGR